MNKILQRFTAVLAVFSLLLTSVAAQTNTGSLCSAPAGVGFGFFNGVQTTRIQAGVGLNEFKIIHGVSTAQGERIRYQLFYNYTNGFEDFVATFRQRLEEQNGLLKGRFELFFTGGKGSGSWWSSITQAVPEAGQLLTAIVDQQLASMLSGLTTIFRNPPTSLTYSEHRLIIDNLLLEVPKLMLVAHSQGNLFVNPAYDYAISKTSASAVGVVHIAPASPRLTGDYHSLANLDFVINGLRVVGTVASITTTIPVYSDRPAGLNAGTKDEFGHVNSGVDILGHGLLEIYLNPALDTAKEIRLAINTKIAALVPSTVRAAAGFFTTTLTWDGPGDVDLHTFEPDGSHVYYANKQGTAGALDVDNTVALGPEHYYASCDASKLLTGTYNISLANYSRADSRIATVQVSSSNGVLGTKSVTLGASTGDVPSVTMFNVVVSKDAQTGAYSAALSP